MVRGSYLQFSHITPNDAGRYFCRAENVHGNVTKVAQVIVKQNEITDNQPGGYYGRKQQVSEGGTISLDCQSPLHNMQSGNTVSLSCKSGTKEFPTFPLNIPLSPSNFSSLPTPAMLHSPLILCIL